MEEAREVRCEAPQLPTAIAEALRRLGGEWLWARSTVGQSGGQVWRLAHADGGNVHYLKRGAGDGAEDLLAELVRLRWLARHVSVPHVAAFVLDGDASWLLTAAMPGRTAWEVLTAHPDESMAIVDALAAFLQQFHAIAPKTLPFHRRYAAPAGSGPRADGCGPRRRGRL